MSLYSEEYLEAVEYGKWFGEDFGEPDFCPICGGELTCFGDCPECDNEAYDE